MRQQQGSGVLERGPARRLTIAIAAVAAVCLAFVGSAQASVITIGSVLPAKFEPTKFERVQTLFNTALPEPGSTLASPVTGAIVRWRVQGAEGGPFSLRVLRPNGKGAYEAVGKSGPETPPDPQVHDFQTNL